MASSNVEYYQRQKELQDILHENEQRRIRLEQQLQNYSNSDQRLAKLKAAKLQRYWNKICEDERRSRERNERIKKDIERIELHAANLSAKSEKLKFLKRQYEEFIERTYPGWQEQVLQWKQLQQGEAGQPHGQYIQTHQVPAIIRQSPEQPHRHTPVHQSPQAQRGAVQRQSSRDWQPAERDVQDSGGDRALRAGDQEGNEEERIAQPVQSVTVERLGRQGPKQPEPVRGPAGPMNPDDAGEEEEELSDFGEDMSLPVSGRAAPTPQHQEERQRAMEIQQDFSSSSSAPRSPVKTGDVTSGTPVPRPDTPRPELSVEGLLLLFTHVEDDFEHALSLEGYYRSTRPSTAQRSDIIHFANNGDDLAVMDAELVSMVILDQLTPVIGNHGCGCILPDTVLRSNTAQMTEGQIRALIPEDFHDIWDRLFEHFKQLVQNKVMETHEVAGVFAPSLVEAGSTCVDKAHTLVVQLLDKAVGDDDTSGQVSPRDAEGGDSQIGTARSSLTPGRGVPPLMFGSLVDKPFSDEESSFLQSAPSEPQVPLNETAAYRSMLSGSMGAKPRVMPQEEDDTDEDVEKQFASALTPRSPADRAARPVSIELSDPPPAPRPNTRSPSEASSPLNSPLYVPTAVSNSSNAGRGTGSRGRVSAASRGRSAGRGIRKPGIQIGSDLDSDTEIDISVTGTHQAHQRDDIDDDFYEFYE